METIFKSKADFRATVFAIGAVGFRIAWAILRLIARYLRVFVIVLPIVGPVF